MSLCNQYFLYMHNSWRNQNGSFSTLSIPLNFFIKTTLWRKISVTKFQKSKIWSDSFEGFSVADVVVYLIFSVNIIFMEKIAKQNGHFLTFWKKWYFIKKLVQFSIFSGHPLLYLIKFNQCNIRAWTNKKNLMHFGAS